MSKRNAPFVAVRTDIRKEERVAVVADIGGYSRYEALGRVVDLWCWCTDRGLEDAPADCEGYAVSEGVIVRFLGPRGVEAILGGGVDEFALGERRPDGLIFLRGTTDTVSRLRAWRNSSSAGGAAASEAVKGRRHRGRFVAKATKAPAGHRQHAGKSPADDRKSTGCDRRDPDPDPDPIPEKELPLAPPAPRPAVEPEPRQQSDHQRVVSEFNTLYTERYGSAPTWDAARGAMVKRLLRSHAADEVIRRARIMLTQPPEFLGRSPCDLPTLVQHFDKLSQPTRAGPQRSAARAPGGGVMGRVEPEKPENYASGDVKL
jgi:hypothetical protein